MNENSLAYTRNSYLKIDEPSLKILENQLSYESMMNKKFSEYSVLCEDTQLKRLCHIAAKTHKNNFKSLLNHLNLHQ